MKPSLLRCKTLVVERRVTRDQGGWALAQQCVSVSGFAHVYVRMYVRTYVHECMYVRTYVRTYVAFFVSMRVLVRLGFGAWMASNSVKQIPANSDL